MKGRFWKLLVFIPFFSIQITSFLLACNKKPDLADLEYELKYVEEQLDLPKLNLSFKSDNVFKNITKNEYVESKISVKNIQQSEGKFVNSSAEIKGSGNSNGEKSLKKNYHLKTKNNIDLLENGKKTNEYILRGSYQDEQEYFYGKNIIKKGGVSEKLLFKISKEILNGFEYVSEFRTYDLYIDDVFYGMYNVFEKIEDVPCKQDVGATYDVDDDAFLIELDTGEPNIKSSENGIDYIKIDKLKNYVNSFTIHSPNPNKYTENGVSKNQFLKKTSNIYIYIYIYIYIC